MSYAESKERMNEVICSVCGGKEFGPGPRGRLSHDGLKPMCRQCGALERHRAMAALLQVVRVDLVREASVVAWRMPTAGLLRDREHKRAASFDDVVDALATRKAETLGRDPAVYVVDYPGNERLSLLVRDFLELADGSVLLVTISPGATRSGWLQDLVESRKDVAIVDVPDPTTKDCQFVLCIGSVAAAIAERRHDIDAVSKMYSSGRVPEQGVADSETFAPDFFDGVCSICGTEGRFRRTQRAIRESYNCPGCNGSLRYQAQAQAVLAWLGLGAESLVQVGLDRKATELRVFEPGISGPFRKILARSRRYEQSYFWPEIATGQLRDGVRCEDLHALTYADECFDLVISSDIFEHVRHPDLAFSETCRVLVPGGAHIFTVPAQEPLREKTVSRVDVSGDEDVYILPPHYHGSPTGEPSLVYNDFGRDLLDLLSEAGFDADLVRGRFPSEIASRVLTFVAVKQPEK